MTTESKVTTTEITFNVDKALASLLAITDKEEKDLKSHFSESDLKNLCETAQKLILEQPALLELDAPINIVGACDPYCCCVDPCAPVSNPIYFCSNVIFSCFWRCLFIKI